MKNFFTVFSARNLELIRDKTTWSWNIFFPIVLILLIAGLFDQKNDNVFQVGIVSDEQQDLTNITTVRHIQFIQYPELETALNKLRHHQLDGVLATGDSLDYWINESSAKGYLLEKILAAQPRPHGLAWVKNVVNGRQIRYLDWVLPGIVGINIMHSCLFGLGFVLVRYRKNGVLKRLKATPLNAFEFLSAQVLSRLLLLLTATIFQFWAMNALFDFVAEGSYWLLLLIAAVGAAAMISLGLVMASRTDNEELAGGLLNLVVWPMVFLSGVWFSLEGAPEIVQKLALLSPLTHILNAARDVMLDGADFAGVLTEISTLFAMTAAFLLVASLRFKWGNE